MNNEYKVPQPDKIYEELDFDGDGKPEEKTIISWKDTVFYGPVRNIRKDQLLDMLTKMKKLPTSYNILSRRIGVIVPRDHYDVICDSLHKEFDESPYVMMCEKMRDSQRFEFFNKDLIEVIRVNDERAILRTRGKRFDEVFVVDPEKFIYESHCQIRASCLSNRLYEIKDLEHINDKNFWYFNFKFPNMINIGELVFQE